MIYDENNPMGTEVITNGNFNGCDSIITVGLSFFPPAESAISETLCEGESITVNGTVYDQGNPSGTEIVVGGSANGCDSTIVVDLSYYPPAQFELLQTLCSGESITVNGMVYD
ncbi:hypothetical protein RZS08_33065, partial [Arthrospira platensis SPKY1]|nr:hypothetical protein [Arthrospira platensis SPKY1]